ncbi:fluoroquinolone transporter permease [Fodinicola acaciae]|uniref:fluoroquinolone export ABC transporter permease subunit n=1 Tax=Fodinicola acaciae TaxID=2681555 RepID=UPI0013D34AC1|nr:fluoroquinolone transporter permease [Fodinicola acaciae]
MRRFSAALRLDLRLQLRYRFLYAAAFSAVAWLALLLPIPAGLRVAAEPPAIMGDLVIVAYFFIAGAVFFEKAERTLSAVIASPLRFAEYLAAKIVTLTGLSVVLTVFVVTATHGLDVNLPLVVLGTGLSAILMLLVGFLTALPFASVTDWFLPAMLPLAIVAQPWFHVTGLSDSPLFFLIPTDGPIFLLAKAFGLVELPAWQLAYAIGYPLLWIAALCWLAPRAFRKFVTDKTGGA